MPSTTAAIFALCLLAAGCAGEWTPADGVHELDGVEQALHRVAEAKLTPDQRKVAKRTVDDVESVIAMVRGSKNLTQAQKKEKVKGAIQELQALKSQWELAAVEGALKKVVQNAHLSPQQLASAKKVVANVDSVVEQIEAGKLKGQEKNKQVAAAVEQLEGLQRQWANATVALKLDVMQKELAAKKAQLAEEEKELKLRTLQKELLEKKMELKRLTKEKDQAEALEKQRQEDAAQHEMVSKLLATAKALAASRKAPVGKAAEAPRAQAKGKGPLDKIPTIKAILANLKARAQNVSASIDRMDAEEKRREADLTKTIEVGESAPKKGKKDPISKGQAVLKMLAKRERRSYRKARAVRESELQELDDGIRSIERGDVAALSRLMGKMQAESKALQAKSKNFLY